MPHTRAWNESLPAGTDQISGGDDEIRATKLDIRERMAVDHIWNDSTATDGYHKKATLKEQSSDPTTLTDYGILYTKDVNGITELFYKDSSGNVLQLTTGGKLNQAVLLSGDQTIDGVKTFTSIPVLPAVDPTSDNQAVRKGFIKTTPTANAPLALDANARFPAGAGLLKNNIAILVGTAADGATIPLPEGFSESECFWIVGLAAGYDEAENPAEAGNGSIWCYTSNAYRTWNDNPLSGRIVTTGSYHKDGWRNGLMRYPTGHPSTQRANYIIIGIK